MNFRSLLALVKFHVAACITTVRWRIVPPFYLIAFISFIVDNRRDQLFGEKLGDDANLWDVGLWFLNDVFNDGFLILLGFMLLVGDDIVRGDKDGTLRSTLLLSRSTLRWWGTKVGSMAVLALAYMSLVSISMMVASLVMGVPVGLQNSVASMRNAGLHIKHPWYILPAGWSTMGYYFFCIFSLAFTMWVIVVVQQALSLFVFPNRRIPFIVFFVWMMLGFVIQPFEASWWDSRFLLYPSKCFTEFGRGFTSVPVFFGMMTAVLLGAMAIGYRKLRRMDF